MTKSEEFLVGDLFCGAGGSSQGCALAVRRLGARLKLVCVNHDKVAITTHRRNHPTAEHYIEDLNGADPERMVPGGRLDLLMASPECRFASRARGGKPINDHLRMSAYAVQRWMTALNIRCILIENVKEFVEWGPLCTLESGHAGAHVHDALGKPGKACDLPDKSKKGKYFEAWLRNIWELGYQFEWRVLNAADFGDATTRERFFLQARKDGFPIRWPEPTHAKTGSSGAMFGKLKPWRAAREVLDLSDHGRSLLDDPKYRKVPLSENTRKRIASGMARFAGPLASLYIELLGIDPATVSAPPGRGQRPQPFLLAQGGGGAPRPVDEPIPTIVSDGYVTLTTPFLIGQYTNNTPKSIGREPVPTILTVARIRLIEPMLAPYYGSGSGETCQSVDIPLPTIPTKDRFALVTPLTVPYGPRADARSVDQPLSTIMTKDRLGLATPTAEPFVMRNNAHATPKAVDDPLGTATSATGGGMYLVEPFIVPKFGERDGQAPRVHSVEDPLPTVTGVGAGRLVQPYIVEPILQAAGAGEVDPRRVVLIDGQPYMLDIRFRMLKNRELARAMGFDDGEARYEFTGTQSQITKQIGNAVPVNLACALVTAILGSAVAAGAIEENLVDGVVA